MPPAREGAGTHPLVRRLRPLAGRARQTMLRLALLLASAPGLRRAVRLIPRLAFNPVDPAFAVDPYPTLRRLRQRDPVYRSAFGTWIVTRHDDALVVLNDPRFGHPDYKTALGRGSNAGSVRITHSDMMSAQNPPHHTRVRKSLSEAFAAQLGPGLRPRIEAMAEQLIDVVQPAGQMDVIPAFAEPLPVAVIGHLFGMPPADSVQCHLWVREGADALGYLPTARRTARAERATGKLRTYFSDLLAERRARPGQDFVSAIAQAQARDTHLSDAELVANCVLFFGAGFETTIAFLGMAIRTLMQQREAWEALRADPALLGTAVDELLRYEAPLQFFGRSALEDVDLGGQRIPRGQTVTVAAGAVNRDPARFPDPDRLDLRRRDSHVTFGHGIHLCVGRGLARLEGQVALDVLMRRLPTLRLIGPPRWRRNSLFRAIDSLPVAW